MKKTLIILLSITAFVGCKDWFVDEDFTLEKRPYTGAEIKTNGYYYSYESKKGIYDNNGISVLVFYKDGISINFGTRGDNVEVENDVFKVNPLWLKNNKSVWGIFNIDNDTIRIENLRGIGRVRGYMYTEIGVIKNDTTICIIREQSSTGEAGTVPYIMNQTYHFKQFSPKPDSTNVFIP